MWMKWMRASGLVLVLLSWGCGRDSQPTERDKTMPNPKSATALAARETIAKIHWLGMTQLGKETNASYFMGIWNLPESQKLEVQTLDKLATAPWRLMLHQASTNATTPMAASPLLRPLLDDLVNAESYVEISQASNQPGQLALAIRLDSARAELWKTNLAKVLESLTGIKPADNPTSVNGNGFTVKKHHAPNLIELTRAGDWTLFGLAQEKNDLLSDFVGRIEKTKSPFAERATNFWLEADVDVVRVGEAFPRLVKIPAAVVPWAPRVYYSMIGDGQNVHTRGDVKFGKDLPLKLEPWTIPTNLIHDPLVSFTAIRGIGPLLDSSKFLTDTLGRPMPNQIYLWALDGTPLETYFAAAVTNASDRLNGLTNSIATKLNGIVSKADLGSFECSATNGIVWGGAPLMSPFLRVSELGSAGFITGGLTEDTRTNRPAMPAEMLKQIVSEQTLYFYAWEITESEIRDLLYTGQLLRLLSDKAQMSPRSLGVVWFQAVGPKLGNCATSASLQNPRSVQITRESSSGFTGLELHLLGDWLESPTFPAGTHSEVAQGGISSMRRRGTNNPPTNTASPTNH